MNGDEEPATVFYIVSQISPNPNADHNFTVMFSLVHNTARKNQIIAFWLARAGFMLPSNWDKALLPILRP